MFVAFAYQFNDLLDYGSLDTILGYCSRQQQRLQPDDRRQHLGRHILVSEETENPLIPLFSSEGWKPFHLRKHLQKREGGVDAAFFPTLRCRFDTALFELFSF